MVTAPRKRSRKAIRLTFAYDADGIRLIDRTKVAKRPPESAPAPEGSVAALIAELRSGSSATYRQTLPDGIPRDVEVFDPRLTRGVYRSPTPPKAGAFSIVVPDDEAADEIVLLTAPEPTARSRGAGTSAAAAPAAPVEIARFKLRG